MKINRYQKSHDVTVIGGGPSGLMAASVLLESGLNVSLYESMPHVGRKFLVAGKGGLNFTHNEPLDLFISRYKEHGKWLRPSIESFDPSAFRDFINNLGFETFTGSSGKVFPKTMKAGPILIAWLNRLKKMGLALFTRHRWCGWSNDGYLLFQTDNEVKKVKPSATVLALGGGSRPELGSDGRWYHLLEKENIALSPLRPSNCGFNIIWSDHFKNRFNGTPVKPVSLTVTDKNGIQTSRKGELIITENGVEGSLVYTMSAIIRDRIEKKGPTTVFIDLLPDRSEKDIAVRLNSKRGSRSLSSHLEKTTGIKGVKAGLIREVFPSETLKNMTLLSGSIKHVPIVFLSPGPLSEAISTAGGVTKESIDSNMMLKKIPGVFLAGEMLDWEAPTGGYLLTACCATGRSAASGVINWLNTLN